MTRLSLAFFLFACCAPLALSFDVPADSTLLLEEDFSSDELPERWTVQNGTWIPKDGVLVGVEVEADRHAASARRVLETTEAVYQFKFRLSEETKGFHFGFDPARGELDKKGHLFSVIFTSVDWRIIKHVDKNKPKEDPNEVLTLTKHHFTPDKWYHLRVTTRGNAVRAEIEGLEPLTAEHPTFGVRKPTLVFRVSGTEVEIDELKVWALKK